MRVIYRKYDYVIIGQGLAGSTLALRLLARKKRILVIDSPDRNHCSTVAAGLFNPITEVRTMKKTWMAEVLFDTLHQFYPAAEQVTGRKFFHPMPLYRPFETVGEQNEWMAQSSDPAYSMFVETVYTVPRYDGLTNPFGGLLLKQSGYLDTAGFLKAVGDLLRAEKCLYDDYFDSDKMEVNEDFVRYNEVEAGRIIFCGGTHVRSGGSFDWAPVTPLKGEMLIIRADLPPGMIFNRGIYLVPEGRDLWKAGATYFYRDTQPGNSREGREELERRVQAALQIPFEVISQTWGLRPASPDRRPMLGMHPASRRLLIFNGLGTKGVSLAPFFSEVLCAYMENGIPLNEEVNIERYKSLYSRSTRL